MSKKKAFTYASKDVPVNYVCEKCKAKGVKLWRDLGVFFAQAVSLYCFDCVCAKTGSVLEIRGDGMVPSRFGGWTDQIRWYGPAVPTLDSESYWGYSSVPDEAVKWWKSLPNRSKNEKS